MTSPHADGVTVETSITCDSSIDLGVTGLFAYITYDRGVSLALPGAVPIALYIHGVTGNEDSFADVDRAGLAAEGYAVLTVGARGSSPTTGALDLNGREPMDLRDLVRAARAAYPAIVSPSVVVTAGFSGGGANAAALLCKLPELCAAHLWFFPPLGFGFRPYDWLFFQPSQAVPILTAGIGLRSAGEEPYRARDLIGAVPLMMACLGAGAPPLRVYSDAEDPVISQETQLALLAGLVAARVDPARYSVTISQPGDTLRYRHGYPQEHPDLFVAELAFAAAMRAVQPVAMPERGSVQVLGWIEFGQLSIWLGSAADPRATGGLDRTAALHFDTVSRIYRVTPELGRTHVYLRDGDAVFAFVTSRTVIVDVVAGTVEELHIALDSPPVSWAPVPPPVAMGTPPAGATATAPPAAWLAVDRRARTRIA